MNGVLNIDKPVGLTSHDVVAHVRRLLATSYQLPTPKVGHTGTLDPFATGVLLVVIGPATRLIQFTHAWDKEYEATFTLGARSDTDDVTGKIVPTTLPAEAHQLAGRRWDKGDIEGVLKSFVGPITQRPPAYSAVKIRGQKLYELARKKKRADLSAEALAEVEALAQAGETKARPVTIHSIHITNYTYPELTVTIQCSTGTFIRSLARDLGEVLSTGAYVSSLRRTRIGQFDIYKSVGLNKLSTGYQQHIHSPASLVSHLPSLILTSHNIEMLRQGKRVEWPPLNTPPPHTPLAFFDENEILVGIGTFDPPTSHLSPQINL